jgi:hypothetical protein
MIFNYFKKGFQIIALIGLIIVIIFAILWIRKMQESAKEAIRTAQLLRKQPVETVSVVRSELKALYPYIDSVMKAAGLNEKHVEKVTNIYHEYKFDTVPAVIIPDSGRQVLNLSMKKDCFQAAGIIDFSGTDIKFSDEDLQRMKFHLTNIELTDTTTTIYYYSRRIKKLFFIPLRIGRKQYFSETYSSCNARTQTESINLIKR